MEIDTRYQLWECGGARQIACLTEFRIMNNESKSLVEETQKYAFDRGLDHAWQWFTLHATQRMQAVNFFLVATAFLSTAYVAALRFPSVGSGSQGIGHIVLPRFLSI